MTVDEAEKTLKASGFTNVKRGTYQGSEKVITVTVNGAPVIPGSSKAYTSDEISVVAN
jgi:hypothetical protein